MKIKKLVTIILTGALASQISSTTVLAKDVESFNLSNDSIIYEEDAKEVESFKLSEDSIVYKNEVNKVKSFEEHLKEKASKKSPAKRIKKVNLKEETKEVIAQTAQSGIVYQDTSHSISNLTNLLFNQDVSHKIYKNGYFANASKLEISQHLMVEPRVGTPQFKYQFLRIDSYHEIDKAKLEKYLSNKGVFKGHAQDFIDAAKENNIDPIYFVAHAMLESGNGTSNLAKGYKIDGKVYHNFFGINAFDANPTYGGVSLAQKEDWSSVGKALHGGAKWIANNYLHSTKYNQKTIYNMRFNPHSENPWHLYATDVSWADIISTIMNEISDLYVDQSSFLFEPVKYN